MKINQIYKVKEGHEGKCKDFEYDTRSKYIQIISIKGNRIEYNILNQDKEPIDECHCFTEDDLELEEEVKEKSLEDLEVGDEVMDKNNRRYKVIKMDITLEQQQGENTLVYDYTLNELKERKFKVYIPD